MRYVNAKYDERVQEQAYRIYVTNSLYYMADNKRISRTYNEIIHPKPEDKRTGDEIALDVMQRAGLSFGE